MLSAGGSRGNDKESKIAVLDKLVPLLKKGELAVRCAMLLLVNVVQNFFGILLWAQAAQFATDRLFLCRTKALPFKQYKEAFERQDTQSGEKYLLTFD